jgi:hypothetical protein
LREHVDESVNDEQTSKVRAARQLVVAINIACPVVGTPTPGNAATPCTNALLSNPSSWSAFRLVTFFVELTVNGVTPA